MRRNLEELTQKLADAKRIEDLQEVVTWLRDAYDIDHIVYHCVRSTGQQWGALTYGAAWVETYIENNFQTVDPVVHACFNGFMPVDWKSLDWSSRPARALLQEGVNHGLGNQGCSMPVRGPAGQFALFTVNGSCSDEEWATFSRERMDDLILAAHYINECALTIDGDQRPFAGKALSPRETDVLTLLAIGQSRAKAADQLKISEHTLRVYIESARAKLGAQNTTHAVAHALSRGLICL
jgi:DNA-binding CsgD family transcriptional regulator